MKRCIFFAAAVLLCFTGCHQRQVKEGENGDPRIAEEKRIRELFPDAPYIITTQEQLDSLLEVANQKIATSPTPGDYLHRGSLFIAGQDYDAALRDMEAGLDLLSPNDTSEIVAKLLSGKASAIQYLELENKASSIHHPVVHIKYTEPINGYDISVDMYPDADGEFLEHYGPATLHFKKGNTEFMVEIDAFLEDHFDAETVLKDGETITLKHTPLPKGKMISEDCTIFFSDVDYDGTKELLIKEPLAGPRGANAYHVYELDGTEREDVPFFAISDLTEFNTTEKSITQTEYSGVILGSDLLKYRLQRDGSFALTDSTHIDYKSDFTDSIRTHYRKQGDKMVLVKKEIVK